MSTGEDEPIRVDWRAVAGNLAANLALAQQGNTTAAAVALASYRAAADMQSRIDAAG